jgi:hypothetical protein
VNLDVRETIEQDPASRIPVLAQLLRLGAPRMEGQFQTADPAEQAYDFHVLCP